MRLAYVIKISIESASSVSLTTRAVLINVVLATMLISTATEARAQASDEAIALQRQVLQQIEKVYGHDHIELTQSLNTLANLYIAEKRYADAEPLLKRTLAIREKAKGPDHIDVGFALNNLAGLYKAQGRDG